MGIGIRARTAAVATVFGVFG
ncbi:MAG: hypothetical protein QOF42_781, partial [Gammaproteobacteria bacterium]|nr:hypothetical protein [Gammaproteobacteria bacterium]